MTALFRTPFTPSSLDEEARTVELIASTGAGVVRADFDGPFVERLDVSPAAVDLSRLDGMPLLDSHRQDALGAVLGVVRGARFEAGNLIVRVQFSPRAELVWQDVKAGIIRNVSIGYGPLEWRDGQDAKGARLRTVTHWELREVSLVPVGADPAAKVRSHMPDTTTAAAPPPETTVPPTETRAAVNGEIRALATTFDLGSDWANGLIDRGASEGEARAAALEAMRTRQTTRPVIAARTTTVGAHDDPTQFRALAGEAVYATRANPRHTLSEPARAYAGFTTLDLAREALRMAGQSSTGLSPADTITRALHTTSDFPAIFADTANRTLREAYTAAPAVMKRLARQSTAKDFRAKTRVQAADLAKLEKVGEAGEYRYSTFIEGKESYRIGTYGTIVALSRQMLINDDIGAFADLAGKLGAAASEFEAQFLVDLLVANAGTGPLMDDGLPVFHASRGNLAATGGQPSQAAISAARLAMRRQKGINGRPISVAPKVLLVPPELETGAEAILAAIQPTRTEDVNPFGGKFDLLVEPRLVDPARWYMAGDPAAIEGLEYSYLQGSEGPQTESRAGFEVDGVEVKVRLDFGAAFLEHRGWYQNPGKEA
jgi:phage head maturation protease